MKPWNSFLMGLTILMLVVSVSWANDIVVTDIDGSVDLMLGEDSFKADPNMSIQNGTALSSENNHSLHLSAGDKLSLKTVPCPVCFRNKAMLSENSANKTHFSLEHGGILAGINPGKSDASFEVETPQLVASVRGTSFWIHVHHDGDETLALNQGSLTVWNKVDRSKFKLDANEALDLFKDPPSTQPRKITVFERDTINQISTTH